MVSRRRFLGLSFVLPWLLPGLFQLRLASNGGWYLLSEETCPVFLVARGQELAVKRSGVGLYTFQYDYLVDDNWLRAFKESTVVLGCDPFGGMDFKSWLPVIVK